MLLTRKSNNQKSNLKNTLVLVAASSYKSKVDIS